MRAIIFFTGAIIFFKLTIYRLIDVGKRTVHTSKNCHFDKPFVGTRKFLSIAAQ